MVLEAAGKAEWKLRYVETLSDSVTGVGGVKSAKFAPHIVIRSSPTGPLIETNDSNEHDKCTGNTIYKCFNYICLFAAN